MPKYVYKAGKKYKIQKESKHLFKPIAVGLFNDYETAARIGQVFGPFIDEIPNHWILASSDKWPTLIRSQIHLFRAVFGGVKPDTNEIIGNYMMKGFPLPPLPELDADEEEIEKYVHAMIMIASDELEILIKQERAFKAHMTEKANEQSTQPPR